MCWISIDWFEISIQSKIYCFSKWNQSDKRANNCKSILHSECSCSWCRLCRQLRCFFFPCYTLYTSLNTFKEDTPNEARRTEWKNTKTATSYRFNGMKRKEWNEKKKRKKTTNSYNKFSSVNSFRLDFLSVSREFHILAWESGSFYVVFLFIRFQLIFVFFIVSLYHSWLKTFCNDVQNDDLVEGIAISRNFLQPLFVRLAFAPIHSL